MTHLVSVLRYGCQFPLMGTTGFPYYEAKVEQDIPGGQIGVSDPFHHGVDRHRPHVSAGLVDGCEGNGQKAGVLDVVDAGHADIVRYVDVEFIQRFQ